MLQLALFWQGLCLPLLAVKGGSSDFLVAPERAGMTLYDYGCGQSP